MWLIGAALALHGPVFTMSMFARYLVALDRGTKTVLCVVGRRGVAGGGKVQLLIVLQVPVRRQETTSYQPTPKIALRSKMRTPSSSLSVAHPFSNIGRPLSFQIPESAVGRKEQLQSDTWSGPLVSGLPYVDAYLCIFVGDLNFVLCAVSIFWISLRIEMVRLRERVTVTERQMLYFVTFLISLVELILTAYRINSTIESSNTYDPIIAELLATSILTALTVPLILQFLQDAGEGNPGNDGTNPRNPRNQHPNKSTLASIFLHRWTVGLLSLAIWIMWLVGAIVATQRWPTRAAAGPGPQGPVLIAIVALAWFAFSMVTLAKYLILIERGIKRVYDDIERRTRAREEKPGT